MVISDYATLGIGLLLLVAGAIGLYHAAMAFAARAGLPPLVVGLTIVGWGTSAPELAFNIASALRDKPALVLGSVAGSNAFLLGPMLGLCAILLPVGISSRVVRDSLPVLLSLVLFIGMAIFRIGAELPNPRVFPTLLLLVFLVYAISTVRLAFRRGSEMEPLAMDAAEAAALRTRYGVGRIAVTFLIAIAMLVIGGELASSGAFVVATALKTEPRVLAATIVSVATTLPELALVGIAIWRRHADLAVGTILGSCIFNAGLVFGTCGLITPIASPTSTPKSFVTLAILSVVAVGLVQSRASWLTRILGLLAIAVYAGYFYIAIRQVFGSMN